MMSHETITNFFIILSFLFVILFKEYQKEKFLILFLLTLFFGGLTDWPMFYAYLAIWLYILFLKDYPRRKEVLIMVPIVVLASLSITLFQIITNSNIANIIKRNALVIRNRKNNTDPTIKTYRRLDNYIRSQKIQN